MPAAGASCGARSVGAAVSARFLMRQALHTRCSFTRHHHPESMESVEMAAPLVELQKQYMTALRRQYALERVASFCAGALAGLLYAIVAYELLR